VFCAEGSEVAAVKADEEAENSEEPDVSLEPMLDMDGPERWGVLYRSVGDVDELETLSRGVSNSGCDVSSGGVAVDTPVSSSK